MMTRVGVTIALLLTLATGTAQAQTREGFWIGGGMGVGSLGVDDGSDRSTAPVGYLKLGGTLSERFLLGGEVNLWIKEDRGLTLTHGNVSAVGYFYPSSTNGFFLKAGLGMSELEIENDRVYVVGDELVIEFNRVSETGIGAVVGLGYDVRVGDNWSITPVLNLNAGAFDGGNTNVAEFAVGVTWH